MARYFFEQVYDFNGKEYTMKWDRIRWWFVIIRGSIFRNSVTTKVKSAKFQKFQYIYFYKQQVYETVSGNSFRQLASLGNSFRQLAPLGNSFRQLAPLGNSFRQLVHLGNSFCQLAPLGSSFRQLAPLGNSFRQLAPLGNSFRQTGPSR